MDKTSRTTLGYHVDGSHSMMHYSRDELSGPLRKLEIIIGLVRSGKFNPDSSRSGYFAQLPVTDTERPAVEESYDDYIPPRPKAMANKPVVAVEENFSDSSEDSASSRDSNKSAVEALKDETAPKLRGVLKPGSELWLHCRFKTMHLSHFDDGSKLSCGKPLTKMYSNISSDVVFPYHKCITCFGRLTADSDV